MFVELFPIASSLDSALKKNTAFIKRLRTGISPATQTSLLGEVRTLSLQKYLSEIISATAEGLGRLKTAGEVAAVAEVVSALHQRFGPAEFTKQLAWLLGRGLVAPDRAQIKSWTQDVREREEKERLARHRVLLRIVTEFWLVGILRSLDDVERPEDAAGVKGKDPGETKSNRGADGPSKAKAILNGLRGETRGEATGDRDAEPFPLEVLKELLGHDREHTNLPLAVLFVKSFAWDVLGIKSTRDDTRKNVAIDGATTSNIKEDALAGTSGEESAGEKQEDDTPIVTASLRQRFMNILVRYLDDVKAHVVRDQKTLNSQNRRNAEAYVKSGEIFEDRQANFEKQTKALDRLIANTQTLCDALGEEMPNLTEKETTENSLVGMVSLIKTGEYLRGSGDGAGIWEDEDERRFYENLVDLKGRVPSMLLEDAKKAKTEDEQVGKKALQTNGEHAATASANGITSSENDDQSTAIANKTVGAQVDTLLTRLPDLQTKEMVDQIAEDFCFLNSKASRNRLIKSVQEVPKGRTDLLPLYARLVATLGQYMPDIVQALISHLDDEFRSLQRRKSKDFLGQVRMLNIRYLAELTKFGVVPEHVIFHCFKVCLDDLSRMNVEITANLLENCGRYLLRNPETSPRMTTFMETLGRKKSGINLGQQERMLIENALYYVDPPQRAAIQQKERTPMDAFIRQLIYLDMTKRNYMKILKTIRKLHWEEPDVSPAIHSCTLKY
jgi:regulator of nonsense transcripts 2